MGKGQAIDRRGRRPGLSVEVQNPEAVVQNPDFKVPQLRLSLSWIFSLFLGTQLLIQLFWIWIEESFSLNQSPED